MEAVEWIQTNWAEILKVIAYIIAAASIIVRLTPTQDDDAVLGKIIKFISKFIALNPEK